MIVCPRCGRPPPPGAESGPFCVYCGRFLSPAKWVASSPAELPAAASQPRRRYSGPPSYRETPRWGFRPGPWNWSSQAQPEAATRRRLTPSQGDPAIAATALTKTLVPLLWTVTVLAAAAAGAETWRYVLLLFSRSDALPAGAVAISDAMALGAGLVAPIAAAGAGILLVLWSLRATAAAAHRGGVRPSRSRREIVLGWLVPGLNLTVPGSVLAEIEHGLLDRPAVERPRPSRLLVIWWLLWVTNVLLAVLVLVWTLRQGVQARADGVLLHALLDVTAAASAAVTAVVVGRLSRLLRVAEQPQRMLLVRVVTPVEQGSADPEAAEPVELVDPEPVDPEPGDPEPVDPEQATAGSPTAPANRG